MIDNNPSCPLFRCDRKMQIIVLDKHPINDGRLERHMKFLYSHNYKIFHIHFNRSDHSLSPGIFSQFGERGYRINNETGYNWIKDNPTYFNLFCFTPLIERIVKKVIQSLEIDTSIPTIFHVHDPALLNLAVMLKKNSFSEAKIVYDRHEVYETKNTICGVKLPLIARLYEIRARNHIDGVVSVSEEHNKSIHQLFPKVMITTVPNFPSKSDYNYEKIVKKINNFKKGMDINFVYVGSLSNKYDRDIDLILEIAERILYNYPNANFFIGGTCNDLKLKNRFVRLKSEFAERFEYMGKITRENTVYITEKAHIGFLLIRPDTTYWIRTSPNKTYEYLICGTIPIIRADVDHAHDFANCSLLFSRETPKEDIIKAVLDLVGDPIKIKNLMEKALVLSNKFTFESIGKNYTDIYESLLDLKEYSSEIPH